MGTSGFSRLKEIGLKARSVLEEDALHQEENVKPKWESFARFWILVARSFTKNRGPVRASALAYTTLLALIPLLAVGISIATGLLKGKDSEEKISRMINTAIEKVAPQLDLVSKSDGTSGLEGRKKVAESIMTYVGNVNSGTLGASAVFALVLVAISLLSTIEGALNDMWGVTVGRSWAMRVVYYWAVITLGPLLLLVMAGLNFGPYFDTTKHWLEKLPWIAHFIYQLMPILVLMLTLAGFYKLMPNAKVQFSAAFAGGAIAGGLIHLNNTFSGIYFGQVVRNSKIYGSLGILPVFLLGLYISWVLLLFGAQVAYAFQNRRVYMQERQAESVNEKGREYLALRIVTFVAQRFVAGLGAPTSLEIGQALQISSRLVSKISQPLVQTKILIEVAGNECGYVPGRPLEAITSYDVMQAIRKGTGQELPTRDDTSRAVVTAEFAAINEAEKRRGSSVTLAALVQQSLHVP